jgi:hypothetical protein
MRKNDATCTALNYQLRLINKFDFVVFQMLCASIIPYLDHKAKAGEHMCARRRWWNLDGLCLNTTSNCDLTCNYLIDPQIRILNYKQTS